MTGYTGGRIEKIKLKNFMTYDSLTLYPKRGLNLIVGLNGSGKSSIMCAICLGLAGKPQHTGRASHLSDFIKHGHNQAIIELELDRPSRRNILIYRKIMSGNKSEWLLNGEETTLSEVLKVVKGFNIDTSNLCQFLPQEKVVEFSKMNKKQRLENLLQSIGEPYLFELFNELKKLRLEYCSIQDAITKLESHKSDQEQRYQRLLPEVEKEEERQRIKEQLKLYEKRKLYLQYRKLQAEVAKLDSEKKLASAKVKELKDKLKEEENNKTEISSLYKNHESHFRNLEEKITSLYENLSRNILKFGEISGQVHCAKVNFDNRMQEKANLKQKLEGLKIQIIAMQEDLSRQIAENENILEHIVTKKEEQEKLNTEIASCSSNLDMLNMEARKVQDQMQSINRKLTDMDNEDRKKINLLRRIDESAHEAYFWLLQNKSRFKHNIYGPILLEIKVTDQSSCKYVENHIPFRDMVAFVCEDAEDSLQFAAVFRQKKLPINVVMTSSDSLSDFKSPNIPLELRRGGISCYLTDLFTAPDPVLRYLCKIYRIHCVPVSKTPLASDLKNLCCNTYSTFYSKDTKVTTLKSRYGSRNLSVREDVIRNKNLLTVQDDTQLSDLRLKSEEIIAKNENLVAHMRELNDCQKSKEKLLEKSRQELQSFFKIKKGMENMEEHLKRKKTMYAKLATEVIDENEEKEKTYTVIKQANYQRLHLLSNQISIFQNILLTVQENVQCILQACSSLKKLDKIERKIGEMNDELISAQEKYHEIKAEKSRLIARGKEIRERISEFEDFLANLMHLPSSLDEVERKIIHFRTQLNLNSEADQSQLDEYKNLVEKLKNLEKEIDQQINQLSSVSKKIAAKKKEWLAPLETHIHNINKNFSKYFKDLHCAGEIGLDTCEGSDDFPNYGLQIMLKYREDEPFMELSQTHHSGGECSVAAIVFILSLQELTDVPFRCIDEINQGMDSINERKIYQLIADNASDGSNSQYFLLTPNLLSNLPYHRNMAVHILHNSCYVNRKIDIKKVLQMSLTE